MGFVKSHSIQARNPLFTRWQGPVLSMHAIAQDLQHAKEGQWTRYVFNRVCDLAWCLSDAPC